MLLVPCVHQQSSPDEEIYYPESDGQPMGETHLHRRQIADLIWTLEQRYADRPDVYVSGDNLLYWEKGNIHKFVSPDVYVVFGPENRLRDVYKVWEEGGHTPDFVIEVLSGLTERNDFDDRQDVYASVLKVPEYYQFDVLGTYLNPRFRGYRLEYGVYVPQEVVDDRLHSDVLDLDLIVVEGMLRFSDSATGELLLSPTALLQVIKAERVQAEAERKRAEAAEAEIVRLRALIESLQRP